MTHSNELLQLALLKNAEKELFVVVVVVVADKIQTKANIKEQNIYIVIKKKNEELRYKCVRAIMTMSGTNIYIYNYTRKHKVFDY